MALIAIEGFDDGFTIERSWPLLDSVGAFGRTGTNATRTGNAGNWNSQKDFADVTTATCFLGVAVQSAGTPYTRNTRRILVRHGSTTHLTLWHNYLDDSVSLVGPFGTDTSAADVLKDVVWNYLEISALIHDTTGTYEVRINGTTVLSGTTVDTRNAGTAGINNFWFAGDHNSDDPHTAYWDDMYILDDTGTDNNDFLGDQRVGLLVPTADGNTSNMTGSDGNQVDNWAMVNVPGSTTSYVESDTLADLDTYTITPFGSTEYTPNGVLLSYYAGKSDVGTKYMRSLLRTGSTGGAQSDNAGVSNNLGIGWAYYDDLYDTNPATSTSFTEGEIAVMEIGQEVRVS